MKTRKALISLVATSLALASVFSFATAANASRMLTLIPSTTVFLPNSDTPAFSISATITTDTGSSQRSDLYIDARTSNFWVLNTANFPSCSTDRLSPSTLADCGVSLKVNGVTISSPQAMAYATSGVMVYILMSPAISTPTDTTFEVGVAAGRFTSDTDTQAWLQMGLGDAGSYLVYDLAVPVFAESTVGFNANGGSGTMPDVTHAGPQDLPLNTFTRDGFTFAGWATSQVDATAGRVTYTDGQEFDFSSNTTLYAVWSEGNGGSGGSGSSKLANTGLDTTTCTSLGALALLAGLATVTGVVLARRRTS